MNYYIRLDDACEKRDVLKWDKIETLLDKHNIKPCVGVIPHCEDPEMDKYNTDSFFWQRVKDWNNKGWVIAMHGYNHVMRKEVGGVLTL